MNRKKTMATAETNAVAYEAGIRMPFARCVTVAVRVLALAAVSVAGLTCLCGCGKRSETPLGASKPITRQAPGYEVLNGKWQRPDGGYLLHIKAVADSGAMEASYFNPSPIHVAKAQASRGSGSLKVFVELRDVNYPGSTYDLAYDPATDRLLGKYYQAVEKTTYEIFFVRMKP